MTTYEELETILTESQKRFEVPQTSKTEELKAEAIKTYLALEKAAEKHYGKNIGLYMFFRIYHDSKSYDTQRPFQVMRAAEMAMVPELLTAYWERESALSRFYKEIRKFRSLPWPAWEYLPDKWSELGKC